MEFRQWRDRADLRAALATRERTLRVGYRGVVPEDVVDAAAEPPDDAAVDALADELDDEAGALVVAERVDEDGDGAAGGDAGSEEGAGDDATVDPDVVGYVRVRYGSTSDWLSALDAEVVELYVDPAQWRQGVGTRLLSAAEEWTPPTLQGTGTEVLAANDRGRAFLEARGFDAEGAGETTLGGEAFESVRYRREDG